MLGCLYRAFVYIPIIFTTPRLIVGGPHGEKLGRVGRTACVVSQTITMDRGYGRPEGRGPRGSYTILKQRDKRERINLF